MARGQYPQPTPKVVRVVCELCDEEWSAHGDSPTTLDCIRLLKIRRQFYPGVVTYPYVWSTTNTSTSYRRPEVA